MGTSRLAVLAASLTLAAALSQATASAAPTVNGIFDLSGAPGHLTAGPDGNIWITLSGSGLGNELAKVTPQGVVTEFDPANVAGPIGITAGDDGNLWVTQAAGVAKVPPADPDSAAKFAIAAIADPRGITSGPDGNLWAASGDKVLRIPPADPANPTEFPVAGMGARGISAGPSLIWVADFAGARIISLNTDGSGVTPYDVGGGPQEVAASSGSQVAYGNPGSVPQEVGRITPGGTPQTTPAPLSDPFGVAFASDGAYWFAQFAAGNLGRLTTDGSYTTLGGLPAASGPRYLTAGPGNTLWVGLETSQAVARVTGVEPPAPPTLPDTKLEGSASAKGKQKQKGKKIVVKVKVKAEEELEAKATGKVKVNPTYKLKAKTKSVPGGKSKKLKLRPKKGKDAKRITRALKKGKKARAKLRVKFTDDVGNKKIERLSVNLTR